MPNPSDLPRSTPETRGIPSAAIHALVDAANRDVQHLHRSGAFYQVLSTRRCSGSALRSC